MTAHDTQPSDEALPSLCFQGPYQQTFQRLYWLIQTPIRWLLSFSHITVSLGLYRLCGEMGVMVLGNGFRGCT